MLTINPTVSSVLLVVLTMVAFVMMIIILTSSSGVYSGDLKNRQHNDCGPSAQCGLFNGECSANRYNCQEGVKAFRWIAAALSIGGIVFIAIVMVIHILQLVGVFQKIVPKKLHQYVKFMHACTASTLFVAEIGLIAYNVKVKCDYTYFTRYDTIYHCRVDKKAGVAMFLIPAVCLFNLACFFIGCFTPDTECRRNRCQPLIEANDPHPQPTPQALTDFPLVAIPLMS